MFCRFWLRVRCVSLSMHWGLALCGVVIAAGVSRAQVSVPETMPVGDTVQSGAVEVVPAIRTFPLPAGIMFERVEIGPDGSMRPVVSAGAEEKLVYSNTMGDYAVAIPAGARIADDLTLTVGPGCRLKRLEFPVVGRIDAAGIAGPYTVSFELFSNCPYSVPQTTATLDAIRIPGTAGQAVFADDAPRLISFPFGLDGVVLPPGVTSVWLAITFTRANAGLVGGAPAQQGFSCEVFDYPGSGSQCNSNFGAYPAWAFSAFNAQLFADASCTDAHVGYRANRPSQGLFNPGANITLTDDIELGVSQCAMVSYEVAVRGTGVYNLELREQCDGPAIPGTATFHAVQGATNVSQILRTVFDPPINIPSRVHFAATLSNSTGGVVVSGLAPCVGDSEDEFGVVQTQGGCNTVPSPIAGQRAVLNVTITCAGPAPTGACCDMQFPDETGESVCREVPKMNCPWPWNTGLQPAWVEAATCDANPFPEPCGVAACCRPDDTCENLTQNECNALLPVDYPRLPQRGRYCGAGDQACPAFMTCLRRVGHCGVARPEQGCENPGCCTETCLADRWCCDVEWDEVCLRESDHCSGLRNLSCAGIGTLYGPVQLHPNASGVINNSWGLTSPYGPPLSCFRGAPGSAGTGTNWYWFEAVDTSIRISSCNTLPPADDTIITVYKATPTGEPEVSCANPIELACNDDSPACGQGLGSDLCLDGLIPGERYLIQVAVHSASGLGVFELDLESPCPATAVATASEKTGDQRESASAEPAAIQPVAPLIAVGGLHLAPVPDNDNVQLVRVAIAGQNDLELLRSIESKRTGIEVWSERSSAMGLEVRATREAREVLRSAGLQYSIVIDDLDAHWDSLFATVAGGDFFSSYQTYEAHVAFLEDLAAAHPTLAETFSLGTSVQGRDLTAIRIGAPGANKPGVLYHGAQHGNEVTGAAAIAFIARQLLTDYDVDPEAKQLVDDLDWFLLPIMNPDGYVGGYRSNAHGVDLNRNWLSFSEPETQALRDFLAAHPRLRSHVDLHTYGYMIMWPWGHTVELTEDDQTFDFIGDEMAARIFSVRGTDYFRRGPIYTTIYPVVGGSIDHSYSEYKLWTFAFELGSSYAAPTWELSSIGQEMYEALSFLSSWVLDCNSNGVDDHVDAQTTSEDCNHNQTPDECEAEDFDGDGSWDLCDQDMDNDGVPNAADICDRTPPGRSVQAKGQPYGDTGGNCVVDYYDFWRFRYCMVDGRLGYPAPHEGCRKCFDTDLNGSIDLSDFADFQNAFVGFDP